MNYIPQDVFRQNVGNKNTQTTDIMTNDKNNTQKGGDNLSEQS